VARGISLPLTSSRTEPISEDKCSELAREAVQTRCAGAVRYFNSKLTVTTVWVSMGAPPSVAGR